MITILLQKILTSLTSLLTGLVTSLTAIDEALDVPVIVKTVTGSVCTFTANITRRLYSYKTTITASGGGGTPSDPVAITGKDSITFSYSHGSDPTINDEIEFTDTCYGGEIDIINGKLKVTHEILDLKDLSFSYNTSSNLAPYFYANISGVKREGDFNTTVYSAKSNFYTCVKRTTLDFVDKTFTFDGSASVVSQIQIKDLDYTDSDLFHASIENAKLVYPLLEPVIIDVPAIDIKAYEGENTYTTDSGNDTTVIYYEKLED